MDGSFRPEAVIGKRQLSGNQHGHLNRARPPHDGPGISTVAPVASGWQNVVIDAAFCINLMALKSGLLARFSTPDKV
jgi:hypothetical protein